MPLGLFLVGLLRTRSLQDPIFLIVFLFLLAFLVEFIGLTKFLGNGIRIIISNLFALLYVIILLAYYCLSLQMRNRLNLYALMIIGGATGLLIIFSFWVDHIKQYPLYAWQLGNLIVIVLSCWMLVIEGRDLNSTIKRKSLFWIALANIVFASGSILDFSIRFYALQLVHPTQIFQVLSRQSIVINAITYSLILKGIWEAGRKT